MKKKLISFCLTAILLLSLLSFSVSAASFSVEAPSSVTVGKSVTVKVTVSDSAALGNWKFRVSYRADLLEYKSMNSSLEDGTVNCSGGGGSLLLSGWTTETSGSKNPSCSLTFNAKKIGNAEISVSAVEVNSFAGAPLSVGNASKSINIVAAPTLSGDNSLATMAISPGELTPAFQINTTSYTASVPFEVTSLAVSATTSHAGARVTVSSTELSVGENTITVTVTAQNGRTKTYTITVTRQESDLAGVTVNAGGSDYTVAHDPTNLPVPEGFTVSTSKIGDKKILSWTSPKNSVTIVYLISEEFSGFFVYDQEKERFEKLQTLTGDATSFLLLNPPEETTIPAGFRPKDLKVEEKQFDAYQNKKLGESIYLVYAMAPDGTLGFYYYDVSTHSFVSYFNAPDGSISAGADADGMSEAALRSELEEEKQTADRLEILVLVLGICIVLMAIGMILLFVFRRRPTQLEEPRRTWENIDEQRYSEGIGDAFEEKAKKTKEDKKNPFRDGRLKF